MSSRVLKQQLSALTRQKGPDTELGPKKKELKSRRKAKSSKAKATSIAPAQEQADQAQAPFAKDKEETLRRNLEYLAAQKNSDHAARSLAKMQQVTQMHCRAHCKSCMSPASKGVSPSVCACSCTSSPPPPPPPPGGHEQWRNGGNGIFRPKHAASNDALVLLRHGLASHQCCVYAAFT